VVMYFLGFGQNKMLQYRHGFDYAVHCCCSLPLLFFPSDK
jgi:hypothetical protein